MWNPHEPLAGTTRRTLGVAGVLGALLLWSALCGAGVVGEYFLPAPWTVGRKLLAMLRDGGDLNLLKASWASGRRVGLAMVAVLVTGVPLGVLMGASPRVNAVLSPLVDPMRSAPIVAVLPIIVLWFGIDESAKIVFLWLGATVYLVPMVRDAIVAVPAQHVVLAQDLGASPLETIWHSVLPLAMPRVFDAVIVSVGIEWTYITVAEYVNARSGLGYLIQNSKRLSANDGVFAGILVILALALLTDQGLKWLKRRLYPWETEA